jgi:WD40 repeat protein
MLLKQVTGGGVYSLAFSKDSATLYIGDGMGWVSAWDRASDEQHNLFQLRGRLASNIWRLAVTENSRMILAATPGSVKVWDAETQEFWPQNDVLSSNYLFALSSDDRTVATVKDHRLIVCWNLDEHGLHPSLPAIRMPDTVMVSDLLFSPRDGRLAVLTERGVYLIDREAKQLERLDSDSEDPVAFSAWGRCLAFSADGKMLAQARECSILLWDVGTRTLRRTIKAGRAFVRQLAFHPDGKMLASGGDTPIVTFWDVATGKRLHRFNWGIGNKILSLLFAPDGMVAAAGGSNRELVVWDVDNS